MLNDNKLSLNNNITLENKNFSIDSKNTRVDQESVFEISSGSFGMTSIVNNYSSNILLHGRNLLLKSTKGDAGGILSLDLNEISIHYIPSEYTPENESSISFTDNLLSITSKNEDSNAYIKMINANEINIYVT